MYKITITTIKKEKNYNRREMEIIIVNTKNIYDAIEVAKELKKPNNETKVEEVK